MCPSISSNQARTVPSIKNGPNHYSTRVQSPVPISVLDRFFESNGIMQTQGYPPTYDHLPLPGLDRPTLDPQSEFLRTELGAAAAGGANIRIFIPNRERMSQATHACVAYAYIMVFA